MIGNFLPPLIGAAAVLAGSLAQADPPMSADAFEVYTTGKKLFYRQAEHEYGAEVYLPGRLVLWSNLDGTCEIGQWAPEGEQICFRYATQDAAQCWTYAQGPEGLIASYQGSDADQSGQTRYETRQGDDTLSCSF